MASLKTKFSVGLFLVIGIAIVIVAVIWLGMSGYLEKGRFYVSYFNESVQGLDKDSPVKYRGVSIGRVTRIIVAPDGRLIEVVMKIESDIELQQQAKDIVAQLSAVGITGLMFIEMDRNPPGGVDHSPVLDFEPPYPVIPTRPSEISKFFQGVQEVFDTLRALDTRTISKEVIAVLNKINKSIDEIALEKMGRELHTTLQKLQGMLQTDKMDQLLTSLSKTSDSLKNMAVNADGGITEVRRTVAGLDRVINNGGGNVQAMTVDLKESAAQVRLAAQSAASLMQNTNRQMDALQRQVLATLQRIDQATQTLNLFLERVANQPSQVVFSQPAKDKPLPP